MHRGRCGETPTHPVDNPPKDGPGPHGRPECYYTSRVLNSTFRYVKFVQKLRATEEEERKGAENQLKELKDKQSSDFFIRCDRRLLELYAAEERDNIRKFAEQAQAGAEAVWRDKQQRLKYLIEKRKAEHAAKYKDIPLAKCADINTSIFKIRAKEAQQIQLYQMKEKQARKMADRELEQFWYAVAMKEADALKARMEIDAIELKRKNLEAKMYSDYQIEQNRMKREKEKAVLKEEALYFKSLWENDILKEEEAERQRAEKRKETARERAQMIEERRETLSRLEAENKLVDDTWDALAGQTLKDDALALDTQRQKDRETNECNRKMIQLKNEIETLRSADDDLFAREAAQRQKAVDEKRCEYIRWANKTSQDVRKAMIDQIKDRKDAKEKLQAKLMEQNEYERQLTKQLGQLIDHKTMVDAQQRKQHQQQLVAQIEYNKLLKERAKQEELDQMKKAKIATEEYHEAMRNMLSRPKFSDNVHPFMKQMDRGLTMQEKCPCSKLDYCK